MSLWRCLKMWRSDRHVYTYTQWQYNLARLREQEESLYTVEGTITILKEDDRVRADNTRKAQSAGVGRGK